MKKHTDQVDMKKLWLGALLAAILLTGITMLAPIEVRQKPAVNAVEAFDHSNCQYPYRTTNPVDGCDNSDPCDPANTKGGSGDCDDADNHAPIVEQPVTPAPAKAQCGGN